MSNNHITPDSTIQITNPKVSLATIIMGIGVTASIVFNYATYGTRIAVLENTVNTQEQTIKRLSDQLTESVNLVNKLHINSEVDRRNIEALYEEKKTSRK